jgi:AraC family ethanolamine operon transcriptional activator
VRFFWRGHHVTANDLLIFPLGGEIECVSAPGFANMVLSVEEEILESAAERMGQSGVSRALRSREVLALPADVMEELRRDLAQLFEAGLHRPHASVSRLQTEAPRALVKALGSVAEHECGLHGTRVRVVREAMALVRDHSGSGLSVTELASLLGVTERSLQRGFRDVVGTTPKAYIQAQRLTAARRLLRTADPSRVRVADVANECDFWHLGQFAADYRRHFGERPSETLRRGPAR